MKNSAISSPISDTEHTVLPPRQKLSPASLLRQFQIIKPCLTLFAEASLCFGATKTLQDTRSMKKIPGLPAHITFWLLIFWILFRPRFQSPQLVQSTGPNLSNGRVFQWVHRNLPYLTKYIPSLIVGFSLLQSMPVKVVTAKVSMIK